MINILLALLISTHILISYTVENNMCIKTTVITQYNSFVWNNTTTKKEIADNKYCERITKPSA